MRSPSQSPVSRRRLDARMELQPFQHKLIYPDLDQVFQEQADHGTEGEEDSNYDDDLRGEERCIRTVETLLMADNGIIAQTYREEFSKIISTTDDWPSRWKQIFAWLLTLMCICFACIAVSYSHTHSKPHQFDPAAFSESFLVLRQQFPSQSQDTFWRPVIRTLKAALMNPEESPQPSVILMFNGPTGKQTVQYLIVKLSEKLTSTLAGRGSQQFIISSINCSHSPYSDRDEGAVALNDYMHRVFGHLKSKVLVLLDAQLLPVGASRTLHAFCDTSSAPYKDVIIIITVSCPFEVNNASNFEVLLRQCLFHDWLQNGLTEERYAALVSRIGASMAVVVPEPKDVLTRY